MWLDIRVEGGGGSGGGGGDGGGRQSRITIQKYHNIFTQRCDDNSGHDSTAYTADYIRLG